MVLPTQPLVRITALLRRKRRRDRRRGEGGNFI